MIILLLQQFSLCNTKSIVNQLFVFLWKKIPNYRKDGKHFIQLVAPKMPFFVIELGVFSLEQFSSTLIHLEFKKSDLRLKNSVVGQLFEAERIYPRKKHTTLAQVSMIAPIFSQGAFASHHY